jgi:hypothetical protein
MDQATHDKLRAQLIAKTWSDADFKAQLLRNPKQTMQDMGFEIPEGVSVEVHEETPEKWLVFLPPAPSSDGELSVEELESVAGGQIYHNPDFSTYEAFKADPKKVGGRFGASS